MRDGICRRLHVCVYADLRPNFSRPAGERRAGVKDRRIFAEAAGATCRIRSAAMIPFGGDTPDD